MDIQTNKSFKYRLEGLDSDFDEFNFVKNFYDTSTYGNNNKNYGEVKEFRVYRVVATVDENEVKAGRDNLMLFHGTSKESAIGILRTGFDNSKSGYFGGDAVYLTDCSYIATDYAHKDVNKRKKYFFVFVNEILIDYENLKLENFVSFEKRQSVSTSICSDFIKFVKTTSVQIEKSQYKTDSSGRLFRNVEVKTASVNDEYCAKAKFVIPRYLIAFETYKMNN